MGLWDSTAGFGLGDCSAPREKSHLVNGSEISPTTLQPTSGFQPWRGSVMTNGKGARERQAAGSAAPTPGPHREQPSPYSPALRPGIPLRRDKGASRSTNHLWRDWSSF